MRRPGVDVGVGLGVGVGVGLGVAVGEGVGVGVGVGVGITSSFVMVNLAVAGVPIVAPLTAVDSAKLIVSSVSTRESLIIRTVND